MSSLDLATRLARIEGIADTQLDLTGKVSVGCHQMLIGIAHDLGVDDTKIAKYERDLANHNQFDFEGLLSECQEKLHRVK